MSNVHAVIEEVSQDVVQSAWPVLCRQDQGNLIGFGRLFHIGGDDEEPRVVHGIIIDVFHQDIEAVHISCRLVGNSRNMRVPHFLNLFGTLGGAEIRMELPFAMVLEVTPALVQALRMGIDFANVFEIRPWQGQQAVLDFDVFLTDDAAVVAVDEVVYVGNATSR